MRDWRFSVSRFLRITINNVRASLGTGDAAKQATMEKERLTYTQPQSEITELKMKISLLADSGTSTNDGYGEPINEGDPGGWH